MLVYTGYFRPERLVEGDILFVTGSYSWPEDMKFPNDDVRFVVTRLGVRMVYDFPYLCKHGFIRLVD